MDREHFAINSLLAEAANLIRREKETAGDVEPAEGYKRGQFEKLKQFATCNDLWIGFAYNSQYEFCAVLVQPYIRAKREATEEEITEYMEALGFEMDYSDEFHNEEYEVFDAVPNNVLYGIDNKLYFIDTQIRLRKTKIWI